MTDVDTQSELERLREELAESKAELKKEQGLATGKTRCLTRGCGHGEHDAEYRRNDVIRYYKDIQGNETMVPENTTVHWELQGKDRCPDCKAPLTQVSPDAKSALGADHIYQYGEPVRA